MAERETGHYWVEHLGSITVGYYSDEYHDKSWLLVGSEELIPESDLIVGEKLNEPPAILFPVAEKAAKADKVCKFRKFYNSSNEAASFITSVGLENFIAITNDSTSLGTFTLTVWFWDDQSTG